MGIAAHLVNCIVNSEKSYFLRQVFLETRRWSRVLYPEKLLVFLLTPYNKIAFEVDTFLYVYIVQRLTGRNVPMPLSVVFTLRTLNPLNSRGDSPDTSPYKIPYTM